jgi:hypothetical protein
MSTRVVTRLLPIVVLLFGFLFLLPTYVAAQARDASLPSFEYQFARALGSDIYHHPINYALHAAGFALPFLHVGEAAEGLLTGAEALKTAFDLNKETQ